MPRARSSPEGSLFLSDGEIAAMVGMTVAEWQAASIALKGLPPRDPVFGNRRYWPAVKAFLDRRAGLGHSSILSVADGEENWSNSRAGRKARSGP
jgi:hypothetical protein